MMTKMKEVATPVPETIAGWHLLTRCAIPKWQEPTVRAAVAHQLNVTAVTEKLKMMFGADSVANHKDLARVHKALRGVASSDALTMEDEWDEWHDAYYDDGDDDAYLATEFHSPVRL